MQASTLDGKYIHHLFSHKGNSNNLNRQRTQFVSTLTLLSFGTDGLNKI